MTGRHVNVVGAHVLTNQFRQMMFVELYILLILVVVDARLSSTGFDLSCTNIGEKLF